MDEYCESVRDGTHDTPKSIEQGEYLVTSKAIKDNSIDFELCYKISKTDYDKINKRSKVEKWDVLMTMIGTVGRLLLVKDVPNYAIKNIALFKIGDEYRAKWFYYYLSTNNIQNYFDMIANGTSQHFIGLGNMRKLKIANFNDNSKLIVDILSKYDELIEINNRRIKLLEQTAEELYKEWFVRFRFPGYQNSKFENGIPKNWEIKSLSDIANIVMGQSPDSEYYNTEKIGLPFHQGVGSYGDLYLIDDMYSSEGKRIAEPNSIIFSVRAPVGRININMKKIIMGRGVASINSKYNYNSFLFWQLKNTFQKEDVIGNGSIFVSVTKSELYKQKVIVPNEALIKRFNIIASNIEKHIRTFYLSNVNLIKQRDLLLPRLMSGKLSVETKTGSVPKVKKVISFDEFCSNMGMAARAKTISDEDLKAMYEAYIDDDATE